MTDVLAALVRRWRDRRAATLDLSMLAALDAGEREAIARDLGLSVGQLTTVVEQGRRSVGLMAEVMEEIGLQPDGLRARDPRLARDMAATCAACDARSTCRRDLAAGRTRQRLADYCPNAGTFSLLVGLPTMRMAE